jgi:hypothetical protein
MGLLVGAVAIAAYISQAHKSWLSSDEFGLERDSGAAHQTRSDTMTGSVSSGPVAGSSGSAAAIAGDLQAARDSLRRNDLASAQAQLDAVRAVHRDDDQVLALQREVAARAELVQHVPVPAQGEQGEKVARQGSKSARSSLASSGKSGRSHESYVARHERANRGSVEAEFRRGTETAGAAVGAVRSSQGRAGGAGAPVVASSSSSGLADVKVVSKVTSMAAASQATQAEQPVQPARPTSALPPGSQAELTAQTAAAPSSSSPQIVSSAGTQLKSEGGPKTRAQVRAEIARARADGSLPAFGNPDPAGPGGAPSLTTAPRP